MASFSGFRSSDGIIQWSFTGLEQPVSSYSFRVVTTDGKSKTWNDGTNYDYTTGHSCGITVSGLGYATFAGTEYYIGYYDVAMQSCPVFPPSGTPSVSADATYSSGTHYINVYWTDVSGETGYNVYANDNIGSGDVYKGSASANAGYMQITVDKEYNLYTVRVQPYNSGGGGSIGSYNVRTRDITPPTLSAFYATDIQKNSITMYAVSSDSGSGVNGHYFYCYDITGSTLLSSATVYGNGGYCLFSGLAADTYYLFKVQPFDNQLNYGSVSSGYSAKTLKDRPSNFAWTNAKFSGGSFNLSAGEWNSFTSKINEFRTYKSLSAYSFTTASSGMDFYAFMFNQAISAINDMSPPTGTPSYKSSGDDVYASYLNDIVSSSNSIS